MDELALVSGNNEPSGYFDTLKVLYRYFDIDDI